MKINKEVKDKIAQKLAERGAVQACPRCGHPNFSLLDGFINLPLNKEVTGDVIIGGPQVPCAVVGCNNCGNLSYHALGALGMLPENKED